MNNIISWPGGKDFAFTIFDDTDLSTIENVKEIYSFLAGCGYRTTKSVWPLCGNRKASLGGSTCEDKEYLEWVNNLRKDGFEIGYHNATFHSSLRDDTMRGIETYAKLFGNYPTVMANHTGCQEGIYWGDSRFNSFNRLMYNILTMYKRHGYYRGHIEGDKYFWGDICKAKIKYVRNFVFSDINTLRACPFMPYHDATKPFVNYWFASSEGANVKSFNQCITEKNQDRLEEQGGACIMYTHFAKGFYQNGNINSRFRVLIDRLSKKNGWFVPVSTLLDYLLAKRGHCNITEVEKKRIERKWLFHKIRVGGT